MRVFSVISGHSLGESYPSAEKQSVYSTAPADWNRNCFGSLLSQNNITRTGSLKRLEDSRLPKQIWVLSAEAVEYTDYFSAVYRIFQWV